MSTDGERQKEWLVTNEAAAILGITREMLIGNAHDMCIRMRRIPGSVRRWYRRDDVLAALARIEAEAEASILPGHADTPPWLDRHKKAARTATA